MEYVWLGSDTPYLDEANIESFGDLHIGRFGGSTMKGANKNEDALYVIQDRDGLWKFSILIDAHNSSQSAKLLIELFKSNRDDLISILDTEDTFFALESYIVGLFSDPEFRNTCRSITGEASCLLCFQRGAYLWWFSVGDCMALLLHPELARFDQYGLNQRQFFEWIGQINTFDQPVPCYTTGRRQLRQGSNCIVLLTDGVLDTSDGYYANPRNLYDALVNEQCVKRNLLSILEHVKAKNAKDSASIICWEYFNHEQGLLPSD